MLCHDYPPVLNSAARLYAGLAEDLTARGHQVTVLTASADRSLADGAAAGLDPEPNDGGSPRVRRVSRLPLPRRMIIARALDQVWVTLALVLMGLVLSRQHGIIVYSPPMPMGLAGWFLSRRWRGAFVLNVQDLYPRTPMDLGAISNRWLVRWAETLERFIYRKAGAVTVHSVGNRDHVAEVLGRGDKVHVVHNWVDLDRLQPGPRENAWRREHSLGGLFVVSFAGTMGFAQGLEYVIEAAKTLRDREGIMFVLAGDGVVRPAIEESVSREALHNVRLFPTQAEDEYIQLLQASDACLVTLHKDLATPVVPGKLQSIMAAGRPAICMANPASDARKIIEEADCGYFIPAGAPGGLAEAVVSLFNDRALAERMGGSGRRHAEAHFGRSKSTERYASLLTALGGTSPTAGERQ